jgi:thiosulfate dehydrogenase [quinone] large subunit
METERIGLNLLGVFRILVGWLMLWAFLDKMFGLGFETPAGSGMIDGGSPSSFVVYVTSGLLKDFYVSLAGNTVIDILLMLGLLALGISLILGIASKLSTIAVSAFLLIMWTLTIPPSDNPIIDYHLILLVGMLAIYFLGGFSVYSVNHLWVKLPIVRDLSILQ